MKNYPGATPYRDRHGKQRWRFRRGKLTVSLRGTPGDELFHACYLAAVEGRSLRADSRKRPDLAPQGIVYVVQVEGTGPVKIGFAIADALARRIAALQTGNPSTLRVIAQADGYQRHERLAHAALVDERLSGEWFSWSARTQTFVQNLASGIDAALHAVGRPPHSRPSLSARAQVVG